MHIALYQPDIPQNTAAILRTAVCFGADVHIVGPAAFDLSDRAVRRAGLDYAQRAQITRHNDTSALFAAVGRVVLFSTHASVAMPAFRFEPGDTLLFGRESAGVPDSVHDACSHAVRIPMARGSRSLNLAVAVAVGLSHAFTTTSHWTELS